MTEAIISVFFFVFVRAIIEFIQNFTTLQPGGIRRIIDWRVNLAPVKRNILPNILTTLVIVASCVHVTKGRPTNKTKL